MSAAETRSITPTSPLTGAEAGTVPITEPDDVAAVVTKSHEAFVTWGSMSHAERKPYLRAFAKHVLRSMDRITDVVRSETGKDRGDVLAEVNAALTALDFFTRKAEGLLRPKKGTSWPYVITKGWTEYHPLGVAGIISPWNYPFYLPTLSATQALSAGCTVVIKPSEITPLSGQLVQDLAIEAGIPEGVVRVIHGYGATGAALVEADTNIIAFTGSPAVGKKIAAAAATTLKPILLELGGKDAQIVLEDAKIKDAAKAAISLGVFNAGQMCVGIERVYVVDEVYPEFMAAATKAAGRVTAATQDKRDIGPLISPPQINVIEDQLKDAVNKGATVVTGGSRIETEHGIYFEPTLLENVDHSMKVMTEETFGPIIPVMRVADEAEALALANDSVYGLHGSVWTRDRRRGAEVAGKMKTGSIAVNDHVVNFVFPSIKLGGIGDSGLTGQLGEEGIKAFTIHRSITSARFWPTTMILGAWLPRTRSPRYWKRLAKLLFGWRR
ncbi:MAG: aldehyde dehydrogenase family protein [Acidimicrobiia bacterium]|nr:aldehyde dehydrogenase family protein [Acidimicrobiia bacterium]MDX2467520.1 aldehyde dehydrogenase family protein [Acidimicrobiia bacterium]